MAIQYYMRAYNTTLVKYVDWVVNDEPDSTGTFSGYPTNQLVNITVNRIVQSKVADFLKINQSLGGVDGYYFHVNSYDWRNAVTPIPPPLNLTGFAVERGVSSIGSITSATNATPINITSSVPHGLANGQIVTINGVTGNTAANGSWPIIVLGPTNFTLTGSVGNGPYTAGGSIFIPTDMSSLTWDEINDVWRLVTITKNNPGDSVTMGVSQSLKVNNFILDGYLAIGLDPADTGAIRLANNQYIFSESNPTGTDIQLIGADTFNRVKLGSLTTDIVYVPGVTVVDGYVQHDGLSGNTAASTGFIREQNNTAIVAFKNLINSFADVTALSSNAFNQVLLGDTVNTGTIHNTSNSAFNITAATATNPVQITVSTPTTFITGQTVYINGITGTIGTDLTNGLNFTVNGKAFSIVVISPTQFTLTGSLGSGLAYTSGGTVYTNNVHQFQVGSTTAVELGINQANSSYFARFPTAAATPLIYQATAGSSLSGQNFTIQSQNAGLGGTNGGNLTLTTGTASTGVANGIINLQTGGVTRVTLSDTTETHIHQTITFSNTAAANSPIITQNSVAAATGQTLTVQAQGTTLGGSVGGTLALSSGTGGAGGNSGTVFIQTGGLTQIVVSPLTILPSDPLFGPPTTGTVIIKGNLEVQGTTTTVESTVVDIIGRVIHGNWADPISSPNINPPSQIAGYSIHRGNFGSGIPRDGGAWIWTENPDGYTHAGADGYWRAVTIPGDGLSLDNFTIANSLNIVGVMGNDFSASSDPNPISGYLASTGSLRTANNVPTTVSRNITASTTVSSASNLVDLGTAPGTVNVASTTPFTTAGTLLILSSTGVQTVTYTNKTGTSFTGVVGGTGIIITGSIVGQTNKSTTFNGISGTNLTGIGTITVVSTVGFPTAGTLRVISRTTSSAIQPPSVQVVTYTGVSPTTFTGVTGGTGFLFVGDTITSLPATGTLDLPLVGTDFGNRVLHGFVPTPTGNLINNTGHIFNTPTGFFYDFQINSVSQVQLRGDTDADSFVKTITIAPTVNTPKIYQVVQPDTGANNGFNLKLQAQAGQQQTGGNTNNNGGNLVLASGAAGTGGAGAAGTHGTVDISTDAILKIRIFPTDASPVGPSGDDNSIIYFENLFRVDTAQLTPRFRQDDTGGATGQVYTIQAQNAVTTGGALTLTSGTGATAGDVNIQTGAVSRVIVHPTFTEFRDTAEALRITPVSAGTTQITYASTVLVAQINQTTTGAATGAPMSIQSQNAATTGGSLTFITGTGATNPGDMIFQIGGTTLLTLFNTAATPNTLQWLSTTTSPVFNQQTTGAVSGQTFTIQSQNAATTGGNLTLTSGTGATAGDVNIQTGAVSRVIVHPTFTEFRDTAEALRITPVSAGTTLITFASTDTAATINHTLTAATPSATMTIQSQVTTAASGQGGNLTLIAGNATGTTSTGGNGILTSGTGTTVAGNVQLQTGAVDRVVVHPTFTEFRDAAEAYRITPVSAGTTTLQAASTVTALTYRQADLTTAAGTGATTTLQAQNETGTTSNGGPLVLTSGTGTTAAGNVSIQTGAVDKIIVHPAFTEFRDTAEALRITPVSAGTTQITFASTDTAAQINQTTTGSATGATMTVQAQNAATTGGDLNLTSGTGGTTHGTVNLQVGGVTNASVTDSKFVMAKGWRRHITQISSGANYDVLLSDDYIAITTLSAPFQINLPATPTLGDSYEVKDATGNAGTQTVTISGNGNNIDGTASIVINQAYVAVTLTYTGSEWSVT